MCHISEWRSQFQAIICCYDNSCNQIPPQLPPPLSPEGNSCVHIYSCLVWCIYSCLVWCIYSCFGVVLPCMCRLSPVAMCILYVIHLKSLVLFVNAAAKLLINFQINSSELSDERLFVVHSQYSLIVAFIRNIKYSIVCLFYND